MRYTGLPWVAWDTPAAILRRGPARMTCGQQLGMSGRAWAGERGWRLSVCFRRLHLEDVVIVERFRDDAHAQRLDALDLCVPAYKESCKV